MTLCAIFCLDLFEIELAAFVLQRPIVQHCLHRSSLYASYRKPILPQMSTTNLCSPLNIVWVPTRQVSAKAPFTHIVPAVCKATGVYGMWVDKCGLQLIGRCCHVNDEGNSPMVQCDSCDQWYHCDCVGEKCADIKNKMWKCGCESLLPYQLVTVR